MMSRPVWKGMTSQSLALTRPLSNGPGRGCPSLSFPVFWLRPSIRGVFRLCTCKLWGKLSWALISSRLFLSISLLLHVPRLSESRDKACCCPSCLTHTVSEAQLLFLLRGMWHVSMFKKKSFVLLLTLNLLFIHCRTDF